jgi:hypothetical protein
MGCDSLTKRLERMVRIMLSAVEVIGACVDCSCSKFGSEWLSLQRWKLASNWEFDHNLYGKQDHCHPKSNKHHAVFDYLT